MAFEIGSVIARVKADISDFKKGMNEVENQTRGFSNDAVSASKKVTTGFAAMGTAAFGVASFATLTAARTETLGVAMDAVAKATGTSTSLLKEQEASLKKQGITTQEARQTLTKFMQSQLDVADASKIARVAQDLAVITGDNSSEMTGRLTDAIATMNPVLLKQAGITKNTSEIFDDYGKTIGKSGSELTDVEKKQAMVNTILKEGEKVAGAYEASMETAGKKLGSLARWIQEANNAIGQYFLPIFGDAIDAVTEFLKRITPENIDKFIARIKEAPVPISALAGAIMFTMVPALIAMAAGVWAVVAPLIPFAIAGAAVGLVINTLIEAMGGWEEVMNRVRPILDLIGKIFKDLILPELQKLWNQVKNQLVPVLKELWQVLEPVLVPVLKVLVVLIGATLLGAIMAFIAILRVAISITTVWIRSVTTAVRTISDYVSSRWEGVLSFLKNIGGRITDALVAPFENARKKIEEISKRIRDAAEKINPFNRESPSLVDNVTKGINAIKRQYASLSDITVPSVALAGVSSGGLNAGSINNATQNISVNVGQVGDMQDVYAIGRELGFRTELDSRMFEN